MTKPTQADLDAATDAGKRAYLRDVGSHGPTFRPPSLVKTANPHPERTQLHRAWQKGYYQDVRKEIAK